MAAIKRQGLKGIKWAKQQEPGALTHLCHGAIAISRPPAPYSAGGRALVSLQERSGWRGKVFCREATHTHSLPRTSPPMHTYPPTHVLHVLPHKPSTHPTPSIFHTHNQTFSMLKVNKSKYKSLMNNGHLAAVLCMAAMEMMPGFSSLINSDQRLQSSSSEFLCFSLT